MADRVGKVFVFLFLAAMFLLALPFLVLSSPVILVRWWQRRRWYGGGSGNPGGAGVFDPVQMPMPEPLAKAWFKTVEAQELLVLVYLVVILSGSTVTVFGTGVDGIGAPIVAVAKALGVLGTI